MPTTVRNLGYTNGTQRLTWSGPDGTVTAHLWGAGGGAGGADRFIGGNGSGGGYTTVNFNVTDGDVLDVAVGGLGANGASGASGAAGGAAGAGYGAVLFNTRTTSATPTVYPYTNPAWCSFLNTYGVWESSPGYANFERTYTVNFPTTSTYTFTFSADNYGSVSLDGSVVIALSGSSSANYRNAYQATVTVPSGNHTIVVRAVNTGGPGCVALTIGNESCYSGGRGGRAGYSGSSGGGGGGGGATVLALNGSVLAVAAGGGGGGGGGVASAGQSAPGSSGQAAVGVAAGQDGQDKSGDGGGGGGGGGGLGGGQGGATPGGDVGGLAGSAGLTGPLNNPPSGRTPGGVTSPYYSTGAAVGGAPGISATSGFAAIVIETTGTNVHDGLQFNAIQQTYIKDAGAWKSVRAIWIKDGGIWKPVDGSVPPVFDLLSNTLGVNSRVWS